MRGAFVVQLGPESIPTEGRFEGWVEEVDSCIELRFRSTEELLKFMGLRFDLVRCSTGKAPADEALRDPPGKKSRQKGKSRDEHQVQSDSSSFHTKNKRRGMSMKDTVTEHAAAEWNESEAIARAQQRECHDSFIYRGVAAEGGARGLSTDRAFARPKLSNFARTPLASKGRTKMGVNMDKLNGFVGQRVAAGGAR
jgi:hypothetical protein